MHHCRFDPRRSCLMHPSYGTHTHPLRALDITSAPTCLSSYFKGVVRQTTNAHRLVLFHGRRAHATQDARPAPRRLFEEERDIGCFDSLSNATVNAGVFATHAEVSNTGCTLSARHGSDHLLPPNSYLHRIVYCRSFHRLCLPLVDPRPRPRPYVGPPRSYFLLISLVL
jgi:hypothetical protein